MSAPQDPLREALREARDRIALYPTHDEGCPVPEWKPESLTFPICRCNHAALLGRLDSALAALPAKPQPPIDVERLAALEEFLAASDAVEAGVVDFTLHASAVERLRAAREALR